MAQEKTAPTMGAKEWMMLLALSALWGGSFFFFKVLVEALPPFTVVLGRVGFAAIGLNLLLVVRRDAMPKDPRLWRAFLLMGLLNNVVPYSLIAFGEMHISSGLASILNATTPIFTVLAAHVLTSNEKLSWTKSTRRPIRLRRRLGARRSEFAAWRAQERPRWRDGMFARRGQLCFRRHLWTPLQGDSAAKGRDRPNHGERLHPSPNRHIGR